MALKVSFASLFFTYPYGHTTCIKFNTKHAQKSCNSNRHLTRNCPKKSPEISHLPSSNNWALSWRLQWKPTYFANSKLYSSSFNMRNNLNASMYLSILSSSYFIECRDDMLNLSPMTLITSAMWSYAMLDFSFIFLIEISSTLISTLCFSKRFLCENVSLILMFSTRLNEYILKSIFLEYNRQRWI